MTKDGTALAIDSAQLISAMFALLPVPVAVTDEHGCVLVANSSFGDIFQGMANSAVMTTREVEVPSGVFRMHTLPLNDQGLRIVYAEDIQDQVHLRRHVAQLERMAAIGRMTAGVVAELNKPLEEIRSYRSLLSGIEVESGARQIFDAVFAQSERAGALVEALSRLSNRTAPRRAPVNLNRIIRDAVSTRGFGSGTRIAELTLELESALPSAIGDTDQIEQVVLSLLANAENAVTCSQGRPAAIEVRTVLRAGRIQLHVTDNGFTRDVTRAFDASQRGVGLALCLEIVKDHGGELYAWSAYGNGTTFTLELPAVQAVADSNRDFGAGLGESLKGKAILVIDDDVHVTELVYDVLSRCGADVNVTHSGEDACERIKRRDYDAIVCDRNMPGLDGVGFYRLVAERSAAAAQRFLLITGDTPDAGWSGLDRLGNVRLLHKPFRVQELVGSVTELFSRNP